MLLKVLIVDDHDEMRSVLTQLVADANDMEVVGVARDGEEAVSLCDEVQPDVIVIDVFLPRMSGIDATRQILERHPQTKIAAISSYPEHPLVSMMLEAGAQAFVHKSRATEELAEAIRHAAQGQVYLGEKVGAA